MFRCIACDHTGDADVIGAQNIRQRALAALRYILFPG